LLVSCDGTSNKIYSRTVQNVTGAHPIDFMQTSSAVMRIASNGNVGIGTTTPLGRLQVNEYTVASQGNQSLHGEVSVFANDGDESLFLGLKDSAYPNRGWAINPVAYGINSSLQIKEHGSTAVRMTIQSGGNVGIGTTDPQAKLDIINSGLSTQLRLSNTISDTTTKYGVITGRHYTNSEENVTGMLITSTSSITGGSVSIGGGVTSANAVNNIKFYTAANNTTLTGTERMRIDSNGNVGIGTTSPDSKLNINGNSGDPSATYTTTAANSTIGIGDFSASGLRMMFGVNPSTPSTWIQGQYTTNQVTSKLLLNPLGGNVGIGITDPTNLLHIKKTGFTRGTFEADGDSQVGIQIIRSNSSNNTNWEIYSPAASTDLRFFNGGDRLTISSSGAIKFNAYNSTNNTGTPTYLLGTDSSGNIVKTNTVPGSGAGPYLPLAGGTMTGINGVLMPDNFKLKFGDATTPDLEIYHDGSNSYIKDNGTGNLRIRSTSLRLENTDSSNMVVANGGDSVSIYYNGSKKLETTSAGVNVTGDIQIDSALLSNQENTDVDTGTETVASVAIATYTAAFFDFVIKKTTNVRSGTVYACHDGTNVEFTETSTQDLGDTSDVTLSVDISGTDMRLRATTTSDDWSIKSLIRAI
jgi:hypothetical protein